MCCKIPTMYIGQHDRTPFAISRLERAEPVRKQAASAPFRTSKCVAALLRVPHQEHDPNNNDKTNPIAYSLFSRHLGIPFVKGFRERLLYQLFPSLFIHLTNQFFVEDVPPLRTTYRKVPRQRSASGRFRSVRTQCATTVALAASKGYAKGFWAISCPQWDSFKAARPEGRAIIGQQCLRASVERREVE
jgi:hypothetical protein